MDQTLQSTGADGDPGTATCRSRAARILTTLEDERRRLERDIHDGAQQHLVALAVNLRLLRVLVTRTRLARAGDRRHGPVGPAERGAHPGTAVGRPVPGRAAEAGPRRPSGGGHGQSRPGDRACRRTASAARRGRADRVLRLSRGAAERDQARGAQRIVVTLTQTETAWPSRWPTTGAGSIPPAPPPDRDGSTWPTGSRGRRTAHRQLGPRPRDHRVRLDSRRRVRRRERGELR